MIFPHDLDITQTIKGNPAKGLPLLDIKRAVLPQSYSVSLVFIGDHLSRKLNKQYRKKDKPTNVLSFPLESTEGEILLNMPLIAREARRAGITARKHTVFLFIHGLLHLKGMEHGSTMEAAEEKILRKFFPPLKADKA